MLERSLYTTGLEGPFGIRQVFTRPVIRKVTSTGIPRLDESIVENPLESHSLINTH